LKFRFAVIVRLKEGLLDPQGKAIEDAMPQMGWRNMSDVSVGKHIELSVEADDEHAAREQVHEVGRRLLSNPVIEEVQVTAVPIDKVWTGRGPGRPSSEAPVA
jgi:phosphoribosylformylglycinamidine synthase subunit PurS